MMKLMLTYFILTQAYEDDFDDDDGGSSSSDNERAKQAAAPKPGKTVCCHIFDVTYEILKSGAKISKTWSILTSLHTSSDL